MLEKQVFLILADGFEEVEAIAPADILRRLGVNVVLAGLDRKTVTGAHGIPVTADVLFADADLSHADAIILPGGMPGAKNLRDSALLTDALRKQNAAGRICAAICAAPSVLEHAGILNGRIVTGYPGCEPLSGSADLHFTGRMTERSGNIITGKGPGAAFLFGREIALALGYDAGTLEKLFKGMMIEA